MYDRNETTEIEATFVHRTERAILITSSEDPSVEGDETWIPKSQIVGNVEDFERGDPVKIDVYLWWADKEGLA